MADLRWFLVLPLALAACTDAPKPGKAVCTPTTGGITNPDYGFFSANFSCETNPIETAFDLNSSSFNTVAGLSTADVIADFDFATDEWSNAGADLVLTDGSTSLTGGSLDDDGDFEIFMVTGHDPDDDGSDALATTLLWSIDGEAIDCDIRFYEGRRAGTDYNWVANATATSGQHDLTHVAVHELGHCAGLDDQDAASTTGDIMFGTYTSGTEYPGLGADDIEAVIFLYGSA